MIQFWGIYIKDESFPGLGFGEPHMLTNEIVCMGSKNCVVQLTNA